MLPTDAGPTDAGPTDAGPTDAGPTDAGPTDAVPAALARHLHTALGAWPPPGRYVHVTTSPRRSSPGWDGTVRPVAGLLTPHGAVLSVPHELLEPASALVSGINPEALLDRGPALARLIGRAGSRLWAGPYRWTTGPTGRLSADQSFQWLPLDDPRLPPWLQPFAGPALVALHAGEVVAGVGIKRHDADCHELAVVTAPEHRSRGLAASLVAQAARAVLDGGAVPVYQHAPGNIASARTADAAGFPDRGWRALVLAH